MKIEEELRNFISKTFHPREDPNKLRYDDLLDTGTLDSLAVLQLIAHLEKTYGIQVGNDEIIAENIGSITRVVEFVKRKQDNR